MKPFDVYPLLPVTPVAASGAVVTSADGQSYLDFYGGHAVISIGHAHPYYVQRMQEQLQRLAFYSNAVRNPLQEELAEKLGDISGYPEYSLFLCNSGAEANENALKLASFHTGRKKIVACTGSFHGRTSAAVAATHDAAIRSALNMQHEVVFIPLNDEAAAEQHIDEQTAAVIVEGLQGVAGVMEPAGDFLRALEAKCRQTGALLVLDEIQSGCGRTGDFFAHAKSGVRPQLITMAKGLGNGFPVGAVLIAPEVQAKHGLLGTTFGGSHMACTAALAVLEAIEKESLQTNARLTGKYLVASLRGLPGVTAVRGRGLMIGVELDRECAPVRRQLLEEHRIFTGASSCKKTIRLLPPLCITQSQAAKAIDAFAAVLQPQQLFAQP